jgi:tetratricopeptide (TPR) repeat protein
MPVLFVSHSPFIFDEFDMICSRILSAATLGTVLAVGSMVIFAPMQPALAADKEKGPTIRPEVGKPLQAAKELMGAKKFKEALSQLQIAEGVKEKTAYENYLVAAVGAAVYVNMQDYPNAIKAVESMISSGQLSAAEVLKYDLNIIDMAYQIKDMATLNEFTTKYYKEGGTDEKPHVLVIQGYYLNKDFANAAKMARASALAQGKAGGKPSEELLKIWMSSEYQTNPTSSGYQDALFTLLQYYPNKDYWSDSLLSVHKTPGYSDKLDLDLARLRVAAGVMKDADGYVEAAKGALDIGLPGEAKNLMDKGYAAGILGQGPEAARQQRLKALAESSSATDQKTLAEEARSADNIPSGNLKLGDAYLSYGQYDQAVAAYQKAIAKGSFKSPIDANLAKLHLGIALINLGQKPKAKDALNSVTGAEGTQALAQLWEIQAGLK